jgi:hypothetical protein
MREMREVRETQTERTYMQALCYRALSCADVVLQPTGAEGTRCSVRYEIICDLGTNKSRSCWQVARMACEQYTVSHML